MIMHEDGEDFNSKLMNLFNIIIIMYVYKSTQGHVQHKSKLI